MKKSIKRTKKSAASKKTVTVIKKTVTRRKSAAAPRRKAAASRSKKAHSAKKSGSFMSSLKKIFFPTFLAMISVLSMNAECGGCKVRPVHERPVRVERVKSECGSCHARAPKVHVEKVRNECGRCHARPAYANSPRTYSARPMVQAQPQTKKALIAEKHDLINEKRAHIAKFEKLKKQGNADTPVAAQHQSRIQELKAMIEEIEDKIESLA